MHGFGFQIDLKLTKFNGSSFFVKSQSAVLNFCHLTSFFILIYCKMRKIFFCQIIMGSPLNSNVSKGRSVHLFRSLPLNVCPPRVAVESILVFDISVLMSWIPSCSRILGRKWVWSSELVSCVRPREYCHRRLTRILLVERLTPLPVNHCGCPSDIYLVEMVPSFVDGSWNLHVPGVVVPALGVMVCRWLRIWHRRAAPLVIS